jgi:NTE family protein
MGLALGAGGARGLAHLGVLKVLDQEKIPVDIIAGASIGALVGGAYASGISPEELVEKVEAYLKSPEFQSSAIKAIEDAHARGEVGLGHKIQSYVMNRYYLVQALFKPAVLSQEDFEAMIQHFIPDIDIEATRIPFRAVSTDLVTGEQIVFSNGSLRQAVMASCAMPGAIEPLRDGDMLLSDGGIICLVPSSAVRKEGAELVIAVAVDRDICTEKEFRTAMTIYTRVCDIMASRLKTQELMDADIIIRPEVGDLHWSEFSQALSLVDAGAQATREKLEAIRHVMPGRKRWFTLWQLRGSHRGKDH